MCAVIDLALNPAQDDIGSLGAEEGRIDKLFELVYPPSRFDKLSAVAGKFSVPLDADDDTIRELQAKLLRASGLRAAPSFDARKATITSLVDLQYSTDVLRSATIGDVEAFLQRASFVVRERHPSLFVLPSSQYLFARYWIQEIKRDPVLAPVVLPPLWTDRKRHIYFGLSHGASHCLIFWSVAASTAYEVFCGKGRIDLSMFPQDVVASGIAEDAVATIFRHYGFAAPKNPL